MHIKCGKRQTPCAAVVVAAGTSSRMAGENKLFSKLGDLPVLAHTLSVFEKCEAIFEIIVVTQQADIFAVGELCRAEKIQKVSKVICGGSERMESALLGVTAASKKAELIAIHDGARPLVTSELIENVIKTAAEKKAAICAVPVTDTLKRGEAGEIIQTVERAGLYAAQTPQVFQAEIIKAALTNAVEKNLKITDDAMAVELLGIPVALVPGGRENIKITYPSDLLLAESIQRLREAEK